MPIRTDRREKIYGFEDFVTDLQMITALETDQAGIIKRISRKLELLLQSTTDFLTEAERQHDEKHYARHMVYLDRNRRFVVMSGVWQPGQGTPVHDHGTWGVMGIVANELRVTNYVRLDDRKKSGYAELRESTGLLCMPGSVSYVLPPNEEIHKVENLSEQTTLSLHVYGRDIIECNMYDLAKRTVMPYNPTYEQGGASDR